MSGFRRVLPLVVAFALACTGKAPEPVPAPAPAAPAGGPGAQAAPADPADAFAAKLTQEKLDRVLAFEQEILPVTARQVALASAPGAGGPFGRPGEPTREEVARRLDDELAAALKKHGLARVDHAGFAALSGGLVQRSAKAAEARAQLARNAELKRTRGKAEAEEKRRLGDRYRLPEWTGGSGTRPLAEPVEQQLQLLVVQTDADRKAFAERHGQAVLDLLDQNSAKILAVREQQVRIVVGASSNR
jgi:hypothetical protein